MRRRRRRVPYMNIALTRRRGAAALLHGCRGLIVELDQIVEGGCAPLRKGKAARSAVGRLESGFALQQRALSGQKSLRQRDVFLARGLRLVSEGGCVGLLLEECSCLVG
jgi:hypothetical protein